MAPLRVVGLSGSLRQGSFNTRILHAAVDLAPPGMLVQPYPLHDIPMYNGDLMVGGEFPASVVALRAAVQSANALLFVSPEYNYSLPAVLKNAIDWLSRTPSPPAAGKACAIMGASPGGLGTSRMQYHLRQVCVFLDLHPLNKPEVMIPRVQEKFSPEGELIDEGTKKIIGDQLIALEAWARKISG